MTATLEPFDDDQPVLVPVDIPQPRKVINAEAVAAGVENRRPVLPPYLRNRVEFVAWCRWQAEYGAHVVRFHAVHSPLYLARLCWWTRTGRLLVEWFRWGSGRGG